MICMGRAWGKTEESKEIVPSPVEDACVILHQSAACCCAAVGPHLASEVCWAAAAAACGWAGEGPEGSLRWPRQRPQCPSGRHFPRAPVGSWPLAPEPPGPAPPSTPPSSASGGTCNAQLSSDCVHAHRDQIELAVMHNKTSVYALLFFDRSSHWLMV